ncbi:MAG: rhodanese-related sulfurtransferase [Rickettsiales bacterium]
MSAIAVSTFYHFTPLSEPKALRTPLLTHMKELGIKGTITLAPEGINATISGAREAVEGMIEHLRAMPPFQTLNHRISYFTNPPFGRSKVKVKRELISLGAEANPSVCVGKYVAPKDWNAIITAPDVVTIDTRNDYEFDIGHFKGAINPATKNFKEMVKFTKEHLDPKKNKRVAMYCTGGIRCEKYSAYLLTQGFEEVYHLEGGILAYLEQIPAADSRWEGHCYVFDERVAVGHGLTKSEGVVMCMGCGRALFKDQTCPKC